MWWWLWYWWQREQRLKGARCAGRGAGMPAAVLCHSCCCWHRLLGTAQSTQLPAACCLHACPELPRVSLVSSGSWVGLPTARSPYRHPPSVVTTWHPSTAYMGHRQAFTALCWTLPCCQLDTMTVHAPHPPSPHPNLVPVSPCSAQQQANTREDGCRTCDGCVVRLQGCMRGPLEVSRLQQQ